MTSNVVDASLPAGTIATIGPLDDDSLTAAKERQDALISCEKG